MEQKVIDFSKLGPDLSRFSLKAKSLCDCWLYARLSCNSRGEWGLTWACPMEQTNAMFELNPETFCQCTGLKDSAGKLIYENDIVKVADRYYTVVFHEPSFTFEINGETDDRNFSTLVSWVTQGVKCVVIGNKWDKEKENEP